MRNILRYALATLLLPSLGANVYSRDQDRQIYESHQPGTSRIYLSRQRDSLSGKDGYSFVGERVSPHLWFEISHFTKNGKVSADIIIHQGKMQTVMLDERISEPQNDAETPYGKSFILEPGQTFKSYDFYLSADRKFLFVERGGIRRFSVGYLYRRISPTKMVPVYINGRRIDNAALVLCANALKIDAKQLGGGARTTHFVGWRGSHKLIFNVEASTYWYSSDSSVKGVPRVDGMWRVIYDLNTGKMAVSPQADYS